MWKSIYKHAKPVAQLFIEEQAEENVLPITNTMRKMKLFEEKSSEKFGKLKYFAYYCIEIEEQTFCS